MAFTTADKAALAEKLAQALEAPVRECGCTLWDVALTKEDGELTLVVTIEREGGISLTDCEMVNDAVNPVLDALDPISEPYSLEVSSPGLERTLKKPAHFIAMCGETIKVKLKKPLEPFGKTLVAKLAAYDPETDTLTLTADGFDTPVGIRRADTSSVKTVFDYGTL